MRCRSSPGKRFSLRNREFTSPCCLCRHAHPQIVLQEHLPYVMPVVFYTAMNNLNWAIGLEVTLSVLGFSNIDRPPSA